MYTYKAPEPGRLLPGSHETYCFEHVSPLVRMCDLILYFLYFGTIRLSSQRYQHNKCYEIFTQGQRDINLTTGISGKSRKRQEGEELCSSLKD